MYPKFVVVKFLCIGEFIITQLANLCIAFEMFALKVVIQGVFREEAFLADIALMFEIVDANFFFKSIKFS